MLLLIPVLVILNLALEANHILNGSPLGLIQTHIVIRIARTRLLNVFILVIKSHTEFNVIEKAIVAPFY